MNIVEWANQIEARVRLLEARAPEFLGYEILASDNHVSIRDIPRPDLLKLGPGIGDFYSLVDDVSLADVGNGIFLHPVDFFSRDSSPTIPVRTANGSEIIQFGSDGGGGLILYNSGDFNILYADGVEIQSGTLMADCADLPQISESFEGLLSSISAAFDRFLTAGEVWTPGI